MADALAQADLLDTLESRARFLEPATESPLLIKARLFDHRGMEVGAIGERERDKAIAFVRRIVEGGSSYEALGKFLTLEELRRLALQVASDNPAAVRHEQTPYALACGVLALLAAIGAAPPPPSTSPEQA